MRENFFIALTILMEKAKAEATPATVHVNLAHIAAVYAHDKGSIIHLSSGETLTVQETMEVINKRAATYGLMRIV